MSRSFIDFGRDRALRNDDHVLDAGSYFGLDLGGESFAAISAHLNGEMLAAFATPEPLTFAMLEAVYHELRRFRPPPTLEESIVWGFRFDRVQPTFDEAFGVAEGDADDLAATVCESHTPQAEERPLTRKESYDEWLERSTRLIDEHRAAGR